MSATTSLGRQTPFWHVPPPVRSAAAASAAGLTPARAIQAASARTKPGAGKQFLTGDDRSSIALPTAVRRASASVPGPARPAGLSAAAATGQPAVWRRLRPRRRPSSPRLPPAGPSVGPASGRAASDGGRLPGQRRQKLLHLNADAACQHVGESSGTAADAGATCGRPWNVSGPAGSIHSKKRHCFRWHSQNRRPRLLPCPSANRTSAGHRPAESEARQSQRGAAASSGAGGSLGRTSGLLATAVVRPVGGAK